jgi:site-specific DNA-cytosine methylase
MKPLRILVACEESQEVTKAFRALGHEAYSCDLKPCSGGHPEWHIQEDVMEVIYFGWELIRNQAGDDLIPVKQWDMIIAFPECTHIAVSGARHFAEKRADGRQRAAIEFFLAMWEAPCDHIAIENPVGIMSGDRKYLKKYYPDLYERAKNLPQPQMIQPWQFGHPESKKTCLWLKGLPELKETKNVYEEMMALPLSKRTRIHYMSPGPLRAEMRSKTYPGIANAMSTQWSNP